MIHYHGLPITPFDAAAQVLAGRHAFVNHTQPQGWEVAVEVCHSIALDNGAFGRWKSGNPVIEWADFYRWCERLFRFPSCDWAVVPDVIDGDEAANDRLLAEWPFGRDRGVPVWHMHESVERLARLAAAWPRIAIGSSAQYAKVGTEPWWDRMALAMSALTDAEGYPRVRIHGLRMLNPAVFTKIPFASADSTNVGRNVNIDKRWTGTYAPPTSGWRAQVIAARIEAQNAPVRWAGPRVTVGSLEDCFT